MYQNPVLGIDVSMHQPNIDWNLIRQAGIKFAWIKTSEGGTDSRGEGYTDPQWYTHRRRADEAGVPWGGYHFARADGDNYFADAENEASWFVKCGGMTGRLPGVLDMESTSLDREATINWCARFCDTINRLTGRNPVVYMGAYFSVNGGSALTNDARLKHCLWWMPAYTADYKLNPDPTQIPWPSSNGPRQFEIWQYTSVGRILGYQGNLDLNVTSQTTLEHLLNSTQEKDEEDMAAIIWTKPDSEWARKVAQITKHTDFGYVAAFQTTATTAVHIPDEPTLKLLWSLGVQDLGQREDEWFKAKSLLPASVAETEVTTAP